MNFIYYFFPTFLTKEIHFYKNYRMDDPMKPLMFKHYNRRLLLKHFNTVYKDQEVLLLVLPLLCINIFYH